MNTLPHNRQPKLLQLVISIAITLAIGGVASFFTIPQIKGWYANLNKPSFNPPNWLFGPVWTILYIMIGVAAYLVWQKRSSTANFAKARNVYLVQLLLNFSWSIVFFRMHQVFGALAVIIFLWMSIVLTMVYFDRISRAATLLLVPYLLWVSFASALNVAIFALN